MDAKEIKDALHQLPEGDRRDLIKELIPEFVKEIRNDPLLRDECIAMLRAKTVAHGQEMVLAATEKVVSTGRAIREKLKRPIDHNTSMKSCGRG